VPRKVQLWTYTKPLAVGRLLLLAVTAVWVSGFVWDLVLGELGIGELVGLAACVVAIAVLTAIALPKMKLWAVSSCLGLALLGLTAGSLLWMPAPHAVNLQTEIYGWVLTAGALAIFVSVILGFVAMPYVGQDPVLEAKKEGH
jgi:hypothetical protein